MDVSLISLATLLIRLFGFWMVLRQVLDLLCNVVLDPFALLRAEFYAISAVYVVLGFLVIAASRFFASLLCRGLEGAGLK